jgi:hypothetical protein
MRHAAPRSARAGRRSNPDGSAGGITSTDPGARPQAAPRPGRAGRASLSVARASQDMASWHQLPYILVVAGALAALVIIRLGTHHLKSGTLVLAGVLLVAAVARLVLPDRRAGMLASRRRWLDVAIFAVFGVGLLVAGLAVPVPG